MNLNGLMYFAVVGLRNQPVGRYYRRFVREDQDGIPPDTTKRLLIRLLEHCRDHVPYYRRIMDRLGESFYDDPETYLTQMPVLTKEIIRTHFDELKSDDLANRRWYENTSSGSTGEAVRFIQDWDYATQSGALKLLYSRLAGREIGECEMLLWGSTSDIARGSHEWRAQLINKLTNTVMVNVFHMTEAEMRACLDLIHARRPKLIVAYVESIYELARFAQRKGIAVDRQSAIMTTAGTLHPLVRQTIERVFQCQVFNRYGSREVGDIASERPGRAGLWVAPWGNYVEVVDDAKQRVAPGAEGEILVTSLTNLAMPFVRYAIGDRGVLGAPASDDGAPVGQVLETVLGRTVDMFRTRTGTVVHASFFAYMLYSREWIRKYQVTQKGYSDVVFKIVPSANGYDLSELNDIAVQTKRVMGEDCQVSFEFLEDIQASSSGKYRYFISEIEGP
jgi:phenylacetate-CoA ligase